MRHEPGAGDQQHGTNWSDTDAHAADTQGPPCQDLRHALGFRFKVKRRRIVNLVDFLFVHGQSLLPCLCSQ